MITLRMSRAIANAVRRIDLNPMHPVSMLSGGDLIRGALSVDRAVLESVDASTGDQEG